MSKNRLRDNTESTQIENRPSAPSAQPVASPRAQATRPKPRPSAPHALATRLPSPAARAPRVPLPPACACEPARPAPGRARSRRAHAPAARPRAPAAPSAMSQHSRQSCDTGCPKLYCNTIFFSTQITASVLQYNPASKPPSSSIAIQSHLSQYNFSLLACNTILYCNST